MDNMRILVQSITGKYAVSMDKGCLLLQQLQKCLNDTEVVIIDFSDVDIIASPFFNASISCLLGSMTIQELQKRIKIEHLGENERDILNISLKNAIEFYKNKQHQS